MAERIPQSVIKRVPLRAYLSTDHLSPATGKTIAITISQNGAAFGNPSGGATNATEVAFGWYYVNLTTTDTGTTGPLIVLGTATGVDSVEVVYAVENAHNAGFDGVPTVASGANGGLATGDANNSVKVQSGTGANQISLSSGAVLLQATQTGVTIPTVSNLTNAPTNGDFTAAMKTSLNAATPASVTGAVASVTSAVTVGTNNDKAGYSLATPPPTASQNAVAVVDQALSGHTTAGTVGGQLNEIGAVTDPLLNPVPGGYAAGTAGAALGKIDAIKAKTDTIGAGALPVVNPVVNAQTLVINAGDDYLAADGRSLDLVYSGLPDFTSGSIILLTITSFRNTTLVTWAGTVLNGTTIRFQPTHVETDVFETGNALSSIFPFKTQITLADGSVITPTPLEKGRVTVNALPG